ncbi:methionine adenosyltransferase [Candidatus Micrarchaeota archaeon]|nr:methionine adenosyltransferase [Candidatus Micrarchaeota archaeon]
MERNIIIEKASYVPVPKRGVELVERKGIGHPDSIIDGIMEEISRGLSREYIKEFGKILHHNVDKGQLCGGATEVEYGGGKFLKPIFFLLTGRATEEAEGKKIEVQHIARETARNYLKGVVRNLDVENDVEIDSRISGGSKDLVELFLRGPAVPFANDTSFGAGFAPFSDVEKIVLEIENYLNSPEYKQIHPEVGEDIKVMGLRQGDKIKVTVAIAFVSKYMSSLQEYAEKKAKVKEDIEKKVKEITPLDTEIFVNTADHEEKGSVYLTLTGTSAEMGDDGSVGRGNRVNGLITPFRSMTLEAAAGKNPVNHVGKIYSVLAHEMAFDIVREYPQVEDVSITLLSQIGKPIDQPKVASIVIVSDEYDTVKDKVHSLVDKQLENVTEITNKIVEGKAKVF